MQQLLKGTTMGVLANREKMTGIHANMGEQTNEFFFPVHNIDFFLVGGRDEKDDHYHIETIEDLIDPIIDDH